MVGYKLATKTENSEVFNSLIVNNVLVLNTVYMLNKESITPPKMLKNGFGLFIFGTVEAAKTYKNLCCQEDKIALLEVEYDPEDILSTKWIPHLAYCFLTQTETIERLMTLHYLASDDYLPNQTIIVSKLIPRREII